jgi:hypothetical protein
MVTLTPFLPPGLTLPSTPPTPHAHPTSPAPAAPTEPGWQQAYRRVSARQDDSPREGEPDATAPAVDTVPTFVPLTPGQPMAEAPAPREPVGQVAPASATALRMAEAARQVAAPAPAAVDGARIWQIELPGTAPGWQLQITQAQPQAPLALELRVPAVMALPAQQQLADLDRRLRDGGHELLRSRLRAGARPNDRHRPVDEVGP